MNKHERYDYLIGKGFLPFEAAQFSKTSEKGMQAPYFQSMIRSRQSQRAYATKQKWDYTKYKKYIHQQYKDKKQTKTDKIGRKHADPWKLLRSWENKMRAQGKAYVSPWKQKKRTPTGKKGGNPVQDKVQLLQGKMATLVKRAAAIGDVAERYAIEQEQKQTQREIDMLRGQAPK